MIHCWSSRWAREYPVLIEIVVVLIVLVWDGTQGRGELPCQGYERGSGPLLVSREISTLRGVSMRAD